MSPCPHAPPPSPSPPPPKPPFPPKTQADSPAPPRPPPPPPLPPLAPGEKPPLQTVDLVLTVADASSIDAAGLAALEAKLAVIGGFATQGAVNPIAMTVTAMPPSTIKVVLSCADLIKLFEAKQRMRGELDSLPEARAFVTSAIPATGATVTAVPYFFGLDPPPPPPAMPPSLTVSLLVEDANAVNVAELKGTLAELVTNYNSNSLGITEAVTLTAEQVQCNDCVTPPYTVVLQITGGGLDNADLWRVEKVLRALFTNVETMNTQFSTIGTGFAALPEYSGLSYPPPPSPPPLAITLGLAQYEAALRGEFDAMDTNRDGSLDRAELRSAFGVGRSEAETTQVIDDLLALTDEDRDSAITWDEFSSLLPPVDESSSNIEGDESNVETGAAGSSATMLALVVLGALFFICAIVIAFYLYRSKKWADGEIETGNLKPISELWTREEGEEKETDMEAQEMALGRPLSAAEKKEAQAKLQAEAEAEARAEADAEAEADIEAAAAQPAAPVVASNLSLDQIHKEGMEMEPAPQDRAASASALAVAQAALAAAEEPTGTPAKDPYETEEADDESALQSEGEQGDEEEEEALVRRIAWIEYYVSKGELDKARELGWSGDMSFLGLNEDGTPMEADAAAGASGSQSNMHRI